MSNPVTHAPFVSPWSDDAKWQQIVDNCSSAVSLSGCLVLSWLIVFRTPKEMGHYKWLLLYFAIMDGLITLVLLLADFHVHSASFEYIAGFSFFPSFFYINNAGYVNGPIAFYKCGYHLWALLVVFGALNWYALPVGYCYRYLALCDQHTKMHRFINKKTTLAACVISIMIISLIHWAIVSFAHNPGTFAYLLEQQNSYIDISYGPFVKDRYNIDYDADRIFVVSNWQNNAIYGVYIAICLPLPFIYAFNTMISILIIRHLRAYRASMSPATYSAHRRLLFALSVQSALPLVNVLIPIYVFYILIMARSGTYGSIETLRAVFSCGLAINPFCTMVMIRPYQLALRDFFLLVLRRKHKSTSAVVTIVDLQ